MKNSISSKKASVFSRSRISRIVCSGVIALGVQCGMSAAYGAEQPIQFGGKIIEGALGDANDNYFPDTGAPYDLYRFVAPKAGQPYVISVLAQFPVNSTVYLIDGQQQFIPLQRASSFVAGGLVQYSGVLEYPGEYVLVIQSNAAELQQGSYLVALTENMFPDRKPVCNGPLPNPVAPIQPGNEPSCAGSGSDGGGGVQDPSCNNPIAVPQPHCAGSSGAVGGGRVAPQGVRHP